MLPAAAAKQATAKQKGFIQLELVCAVLLIVTLTAALLVGTGGYNRQQKKMQVQAAAVMLAADIRNMQQQAMFSDGVLNRQIKVTADSGGYALYKDRKVIRKVQFAEQGCGEVYFSRKIAQAQFTNTGSPSTTGDFELQHRKLSGYKYTVSIQPVTGRVVVSEE